MFTTSRQSRNRISSSPRLSANRSGTRTVLATPLLREGVPIGVIMIRRIEVRPFSEKQIELARDLRRPGRDRHRERAAVQGTQERNAELREALEHQTATAEVLGIISRSPTDVQPVLDAIVESAARVCGIDDVVLRLHEGEHDDFAGSFWFSHTHWPRSRSVLMSHVSRWMREHGTLHIPDIRAQNDFPMWVPRQLVAPSWPFPFASRGNSLEH